MWNKCRHVKGVTIHWMYWTWTDTPEILQAFLTPKRNWQNPRFRWDSIWIRKIWKLGRFLVENFSVSNTCQSLYVPQSTLKATEYTVSYPIINQATTEGRQARFFLRTSCVEKVQLYGRYSGSSPRIIWPKPDIWAHWQGCPTEAHLIPLLSTMIHAVGISWLILCLFQNTAVNGFQQMKAAKCFCQVMQKCVNAYRNNYRQNNTWIYGKNVEFRQSYPLIGTFLDSNILSMP